MPLPIGFFMPLPLPIMIPFMMWQSAAIAAGFGTYFQFAKRRVSAMSNEEFNKADPHQLVNSLYEDIVQQIPSSFAKVDSLTPVMLQSMNVMLDQAVKWLQGAITGNFFGTPNPSMDDGSGPPIDDTPPLPDLISLSAATILGWSETKLFHEFNNNLQLYDSETRLIIESRFNVVNRDKEEEESITKPLDKIPGKVRTFPYFPGSVSNLIIDGINAAFLVSNTKGFLALGTHLDAFQRIINLGRSTADIQRGQRGKAHIQSLILQANDDLKISGGLN